MEIPKPVAIAVVAIVLVLALAGVWFFAGGGGGGGSSVPESVYPKSEGGEGVEAYGIQPEYTGTQPAESIPLEGGGGRR